MADSWGQWEVEWYFYHLPGLHRPLDGFSFLWSSFRLLTKIVCFSKFRLLQYYSVYFCSTWCSLESPTLLQHSAIENVWAPAETFLRFEKESLNRSVMFLLSFHQLSRISLALKAVFLTLTNTFLFRGSTENVRAWADFKEPHYVINIKCWKPLNMQMVCSAELCF